MFVVLSLPPPVCLQHYYGEGCLLHLVVGFLKWSYFLQAVRWGPEHFDWSQYGPFSLTATNLIACYVLSMQYEYRNLWFFPFLFSHSIVFLIFAKQKFRFSQLAIYIQWFVKNSDQTTITHKYKTKKNIYILNLRTYILAVNQLKIIIALSSVQSNCYYISCRPLLSWFYKCNSISKMCIWDLETFWSSSFMAEVISSVCKS